MLLIPISSRTIALWLPELNCHFKLFYGAQACFCIHESLKLCFRNGGSVNCQMHTLTYVAIIRLSIYLEEIR